MHMLKITNFLPSYTHSHEITNTSILSVIYTSWVCMGNSTMKMPISIAMKDGHCWKYVRSQLHSYNSYVYSYVATVFGT